MAPISELIFKKVAKVFRNFDALRWVKLEGGSRHLLCHQTGQGLALWTDVIRGVRSPKLEGGGGVGN